MGEDFWDNFLPQAIARGENQGQGRGQVHGPGLNVADFPPGWVPGGFDDEMEEPDDDAPDQEAEGDGEDDAHDLRDRDDREEDGAEEDHENEPVPVSGVLV